MQTMQNHGSSFSVHHCTKEAVRNMVNHKPVVNHRESFWIGNIMPVLYRTLMKTSETAAGKKLLVEYLQTAATFG